MKSLIVISIIALALTSFYLFQNKATQNYELENIRGESIYLKIYNKDLYLTMTEYIMDLAPTEYASDLLPKETGNDRQKMFRWDYNLEENIVKFLVSDDFAYYLGQKYGSADFYQVSMQNYYNWRLASHNEIEGAFYITYDINGKYLCGTQLSDSNTGEYCLWQQEILN